MKINSGWKDSPVKQSLKVFLSAVLIVSGGWGFFAHQKINRLAVFTLPPEMLGFYKMNIQTLSEMATNPDRRRYAVPDEAPRHFIDAEDYGDSAWLIMPKYWNAAVDKYGEDSLNAHGIVPWHIFRMFNQLKAAFLLGDPEKIIRNSAELGHYVGDAHVPLHTSNNYNGQLTGQNGIHAFWESRVPELFFLTYDFYVGKARYIKDPQQAAWDVVWQSHALVDSVLLEEKLLTEQMTGKFNYETKGKQTIRVYSTAFSERYHEKLSGMVERRFRGSIKMTGDFWYTAWVDAGEPDLNRLIGYKPTEEELKRKEEEIKKWKERNFISREHESEY